MSTPGRLQVPRQHGRAWFPHNPTGANMERFNVITWFPDGAYIYEAGGDNKHRGPLPGEEAVYLARDLTRRPAALLGIIDKVQITDADDFTVFLWEKGKVVFPTREECGAA